MKKTIFLSAFLILSLCGYSQKEKVYPKVLYKNITQENDLCEIKISDIVADAGSVKFKMRVDNRTGDFILINPAQFKFMINGKEVSVKEKEFMVQPNDWNSKVINISQPEMNTLKGFSGKLEGWSKCPTEGKVLEAEDVSLGSKSSAKAGPVSINISQFKKDTDKTDVKVACANNGSGVCFIFQNRITVYMPDAQEYVNITTKVKPVMLLKGESENIWLHWDRMPGGKINDMQKVPMIIKWHDAFVESSPVKVPGFDLNFEWDEALTKEKN